MLGAWSSDIFSFSLNGSSTFLWFAYDITSRRSIFILNWICWGEKSEIGRKKLWIDIYCVAVSNIDSPLCFLHSENFHSVVELSRYKEGEGFFSENSRKLRTRIFFNRSIVRSQLYDFLSLFILLCLTTIHHSINRKLLYISFEHEPNFIRRRWILSEKFEYLLICLKESPRNLWLGLSMSHEILSEDAFARSCICMLKPSVCALTYYFSCWVRGTSFERGSEKKTQTVQSTLHGGLCVGRFFVLNLSRQHKKVHGLFKRDIFFSSLSTRFCSGDWLDWRRMEILQSTKVLELVTVFFALNIYCLVWRIRETNKWIIQFASWTIEWKFVFSAIVSVNLAVIIS